jgi:hypothetical protein
MFTVVLPFAFLYQPVLAAVAGAAAATAVERSRPQHPLWDDNWMVPAASLAAIVAARYALGPGA